MLNNMINNALPCLTRTLTLELSAMLFPVTTFAWESVSVIFLILQDCWVFLVALNFYHSMSINTIKCLLQIYKQYIYLHIILICLF